LGFDDSHILHKIIRKTARFSKCSSLFIQRSTF
jgi:hypothetical protein